MNEEIELGQILFIIRNKIGTIILCTLLVAGAAFGISNYLITPLYSASTSLYVYNETSREAITSSDLNTSQELVQTYIVILTSNAVLNKVSDVLNNQYTVEDLREMIEATAINNTEAFSVTVENADPVMAQKIANTIATVAPSEIIRVVKAGSVEVIDYATLPEKQSSPNVIRNTAIGGLLGCILSIGVLILKKMLDTVIRSEEDLIENFNIPILGVIPPLSNGELDGGSKK
ncbi:MAG: Wzz/FepE/Etk N-terminal domain-containing protein [Candidatus Metalachnospira sp.]|nr:Wzz/FepE/Etk N-terminal domain-containing protein [Candidatus Metalachnospira sp.]